MKLLQSTLIALALLVASIDTSHAWFKLGYVLCDSNTNGVIDSADVGVPGVLVVVTNATGTFSNANWTGPDGLFIVDLPAEADTYFDYAHPATLPAGTVSITPGLSSFTISPANTIVTNNFLITNPACVGTPPPRHGCWLTGGGTTGGTKSKPANSFGGVVFPGCNPSSSDGGNWNNVAHNLRLHFKGLSITNVTCGNVPGAPPGSSSPKTPFNFIEFSGTGTLKGISGNRADYGTVSFFARAEDLGEPAKGKDRYYLRVYNAAGVTLLLVSADAANPLNVAPVAISGGNLQLHASGCD